MINEMYLQLVTAPSEFKGMLLSQLAGKPAKYASKFILTFNGPNTIMVWYTRV